ncbi:MaoC family dehydratase N-terminal domain-containing protein [Enterococcus sp. BWB1-3]|uniref:MaoC/PaaZ C-terminal domain-containing protein n=1 Tax=unclassified Enterococcus TaxID=2608891 RepID=UPI001921795B|nr:MULTISPECIES: MaoC/PaaZ C-terminal domain-containing protein [unclassified Enterococcus]MBL1229432.1 MaoC family dehydratase N-terminal domain-containing protein [Enterococcus sp. BWB1-3]MCB5952603.1 MaoC family dehydratase N-terminal domain-containing protein [Enterococcus sp. BWT-B8]MCB5956293.1 MaoC family dehydratase N-terminal domain-containing protein [Enterococcus sp. CWB-B31]
MNIGKPRKLGKTIEDIEEGDSLSLTESIEDKDLLLYLGLTNDANPLYIQHDYAKQTEYQKPIVPSIMLMGIITSAISKHLPGPGSHVVNFSINFLEPVFHYETLTFQFEVIKIDKMKDVVTISIEAVNEEENRVLDAVVLVQPPKHVDLEEPEEKEGVRNESV